MSEAVWPIDKEGGILKQRTTDDDRAERDSIQKRPRSRLSRIAAAAMHRLEM